MIQTTASPATIKAVNAVNKARAARVRAQAAITLATEAENAAWRLLAKVQQTNETVRSTNDEDAPITVAAWVEP